MSDLISRDAVLDYIHRILNQGMGKKKSFEFIQKYVEKLSPVNPQEPYDFAKWVATEIFDDNWEYNKDAFAEIACRKLAKLGIVRSKGDEWELVDPQESDNCRDCKKWKDCPCGKDGHESGTSQGYSIGECKNFEPQERSDTER